MDNELSGGLKYYFIQIVDNQIQENKPPEALTTFNRLINSGFSIKEAKGMIAAVMASSIYDVINDEKTFDLKKYIRLLEDLPKLP